MHRLLPLTAIFLLTATALLATCGCSRNDTGSSGRQPTDSEMSSEISDMTTEAYAWADSMMRAMTLEQRVGQTLLPAVYAEDDARSLRRIRSYAADLHVGGVVLLKGTREAATVVAIELKSISNIEPFVAIDAEWGLGMRLSGTPRFPQNSAIAKNAEQNLLYDYGSEVARECRLTGINMVLGPVADVAREGSPLRKRSFGSDAGRVAEMTVAYARGLEDGNVLSVAKHFPGLGSPEKDSHLGKVSVGAGYAQLDSIDLLPFKRYAEAGLSGIMAGHLAVPAIDSSGVPASFSKPVLTGLLREKMGFGGLILTDALNMGGAEGHDAVEALRAGADIILAPADTYREFAGIMHAVREGSLPVAVINDRCRRILFYKYLVRRPLPYSGPDSSDFINTRTDSLRRLLEAAP